MAVVAVDTNALMMPVELGVRLFEELDRLFAGGDLGGDLAGPDAAFGGDSPPSAGYELVVPRPVLEELEKLSSGAGKEAVAASVGADLADRCRVVDTEESYADDAVVELAERGLCDFVVTNDGPLQNRLLGRNVRVIGLRGRNTLSITEP